MSKLNIILTDEVEEALNSDSLNFEKLNDLVKKCQVAHTRNESVPDAIYDVLFLRLQEAAASLKAKGISVGDSAADILWEDSTLSSADSEDIIDLVDLEEEGFYRDVEVSEKSEEEITEDSYYLNYFDTPMFSITTVKDWSDKRIQELAGYNKNLHFSFKLNGHAVRVFYDDGVLVYAATRGRVGAAKNIAPQMKNILGLENEALRGMGIVEIRGEVVLKESNIDKAREFKSGLVSPFSAVSSMIRASSTLEENKLLDFIAYRIMGNGLEFGTKQAEYAFIKDHGFTTPPYSIKAIDSVESMQAAFQEFEDSIEKYGYMCDGVIAEVNDRRLFKVLGDDGLRNKGNLALKVGLWSQDMYTGIVKSVKWVENKSSIVPVVIVDDPSNADRDFVPRDKEGVLTDQGNRVRNIPVYNARTLRILGVTEGGLINFRYGGEAGVVPCDPKGRPMKDIVSEYLATTA